MKGCSSSSAFLRWYCGGGPL